MRPYILAVCLTLCLSGLLFAPVEVEARLVPVECESPQTCGTCEFVQLTNNVIQFILVISSSIAVLLFIYAGFRLLFSGGNVAAATAARSTITNVAIGYIIVLAAFLIIDLVMGALLPGDSPSLSWKTVQCIYPVESKERPRGNGSLDVGAGGGGGGGSLSQCPAGNVACSVAALQTAGFTADEANVMSCIAMTESSGNPSARSNSSSACGTFQVIKGTWESAASGRCAAFSNCTDAACNEQVTRTLVSRNGYNDWTCPNCNAKAKGCIAKFGS